MTKARIGVTAFGVVGLAITLITQLWWVISKWQELEQLVEDAPRIVKWLGHPLAGPGIAVLAVIAYGAMVFYERNAKAKSMVGKFFHTMKADGAIDYQGYVLRDEAARYFVQILSFYDGYPSTQRYLTSAETQTVRFYDTRRQMLDAYYRAHPEIDRGLAEFAAEDLGED